MLLAIQYELGMADGFANGVFGANNGLRVFSIYQTYGDGAQYFSYQHSIIQNA